MLKKAREMGDKLIVGLNETKNGKQTYYTFEERKKILESIKYVDKVVKISEQKDKYVYLQEANIFAIGSDYIGYEDIKDIEKYCEVKFINRTPNISSTRVKKHLSDNTRYNTFVIDLDDTICFTENRDFKNSNPYKEVVNKINELYDKGWKIIIFTARGAKSCATLLDREIKYRGITEAWLNRNNVKYTELVFGKMNADYYVDDKNMSIEEFINFKE